MLIRVSYVDLARTLHEKRAINELPPLSKLTPVRRRWSSGQQRHTPGFYYFSTLKKHVFYESYLESKILSHFDFEGETQRLVEQPFALHYSKKKHYPDFVMQSTSEKITVVNVKPAAFLDLPANIADFEIADEFARVQGWHHRIMTELNPQYIDNLQWLSGFRATPFELKGISEQVFNLLEESISLKHIIDEIGREIFVKPVIFHLLWHRRLKTDLEQRFSLEMPIWRGEG